MLNHLKVTYSNTTPDNAEFMANCIMQGAKYLKIELRETISQSSHADPAGITVTEIKLDDRLPVINQPSLMDQVSDTRQSPAIKPQAARSKKDAYDFVGVAG